MSISYLLLFASRILLGAILCYFILKGILSKSHGPIKDYNELTKTFGDLQLQNASKFSKQEIENSYVTRDLFNNCSIQLENVTKEFKEKTQVIIELTALSEQKFSKEEVSQKYVPQESYTIVFEKLKEQEEKNKEDGDKLIVVHKEKSRLEEENKNLLERLTKFKKELEEWDIQAKEQFKNLTNEIFNQLTLI